MTFLWMHQYTITNFGKTAHFREAGALGIRNNKNNQRLSAVFSTDNNSSAALANAVTPVLMVTLMSG